MSDKGSRFLGTLNNPTEFAGDWLESFYNRSKAVYLNGQLEKGENGTPHIQFYVSFKDPKRLTALKKLCPHSHFEVVKKDNGASSYAMKEETRLEGPWEFGTKPLKRNDAKDWEEIKEKAKAGDLDSIPADVYIRHYRTLKEIKKDHMKVQPRTCPRCCYWYWGDAGTGKSRTACEKFPDAYMKMQNKWWDGYQGEKSVILDEFGKDHVVLGNHLKKWADPWIPFVAEAKGGALTPDYDNFIVTSNYSMEELFGQDPQILQPLQRRFQQVHFNEPIYRGPGTGIIGSQDQSDTRGLGIQSLGEQVIQQRPKPTRSELGFPDIVDEVFNLE